LTSTALRVWRIRVPAYTALLYAGLLAGTYTTYAAARVDGLRSARLAPAILMLVALAVAGARLAFVAGRWPTFRRSPSRILARDEGGAVAYGALIAVPLSLPLLVSLGIPVTTFWDAGALGFLAATIFLRIGCTMNGCCCGRVTRGRFGIELPKAGEVAVRRVPTQLLEASWAAALLAVGVFALGRMPFGGAVFLGLLASYAFGRFVLGFAREEPRSVGPLTVSQVFSIVFVLLAVLAFAVAVLEP
jgi:phosphatidylglycerol---prolipoprotein diacylglyceryl transferase